MSRSCVHRPCLLTNVFKFLCNSRRVPQFLMNPPPPFKRYQPGACDGVRSSPGCVLGFFYFYLFIYFFITLFYRLPRDSWRDFKTSVSPPCPRSKTGHGFTFKFTPVIIPPDWTNRTRVVVRTLLLLLTRSGFSVHARSPNPRLVRAPCCPFPIVLLGENRGGCFDVCVRRSTFSASLYVLRTCV